MGETCKIDTTFKDGDVFVQDKPNLRQLIEGCREEVSSAIFNSSKSYIASEKDCQKEAQAAISAIVERLTKEGGV